MPTILSVSHACADHLRHSTLTRRALMLGLLAASLVSLACGARGAQLTQADIDTSGTRTFDAPIAKVFVAAQSGLVADGYELALVNPERGIIKTKRKFLRAAASATSSYSATAVEISRQYLLTVTAVDAGKTRVQVTPRVYQGDADLSAGAVWDMESPQGERALWNRLFKEIADSL